MCMWKVGWLLVPPRHLVAPTGSANATAWVTLRRFAPHRLIFLFSISSLAASLHMGSLHPAVVFIITAVFSVVLFLWLYLTALNCCSPGCFNYYYFILFLKCEYGVELWEWCQLLIDAVKQPPWQDISIFSCAYLKTNECVLFSFFFYATYKNKMFKYHRQFMERQMGGWRVVVGNESVFEKRTITVWGEKQEDFDSDIFTPCWDYIFFPVAFLLCTFFRFSHF